MVFAEAGTSNGSGLISFKKGAFHAMKPVRPMYMKYKWGTFNPAYDCINFIPQAILLFSWCCIGCDVSILPQFIPNEYLFTKHADKGKEPWEIYAWAVRDVMMKSGHFDSIDMPLKYKFKYEKHMM